jgi:hypothetical protein
MPDKKKIDDFTNSWMSEIKFGLDYRKKYSTRSSWDTYRKYYRGQWAKGIIPINKIFSYGRMLMPRVYFRAPRVTVTPSRPDLIWHAKVVEAIDNLLIKTIMLKKTLKKAILDSYLCGIGCIKLGYDSEFGYIPSQAVAEGGETVTQYSTKEKSEKIEYSQMVKPGMPWALRARPEDVVVPWGSQDEDSLPWVAHYILRPLDDVKQDQKYDRTKTKGLQGTRSPTMGNDVRSRDAFRPRSERDKGITYAELWEVRDFKTKQFMTFCEDEMILSDGDALQTRGGIPWEFIIFNPDPEYFWPIPDAHIIAPQQEELNDTASQVSRHRAIALLKFLYKKGAILKEELEKALSGNVGVAVGVEQEVENLQNAITTLQPHIPPDLYRDMAQQIQSMREELGFSQNQEGAFSPYHGKTATESMIVAEGFEERVDERRDITADVLVNIIRKWNWFLFDFWTEDKVIQIVTPQGEPAWISYTGDQLKGEYLLSIDAESGMPISRSLKYQMGSELMKNYNGDQLIDQIMLRQINLDNYSIIDPRIPMLLQPQFAGRPEEVSAIRQPSPITGGGGKGSAGGRKGSSPQKPEEFESFKKRMELRK